jgi:hypothetical protein
MEFLFELFGALNTGEGGLNEQVGVKQLFEFGCKDLSVLNIEKEGFNQGGGVPYGL